MIVFKTKNYLKSIKSLPNKDKVLLSKLENLLADDIFNSKLHTKKLKGFPDDKVFSFRITSKHRAIFRISNENIILFDIGHRKDIYNNLD